MALKAGREVVGSTGGLLVAGGGGGGVAASASFSSGHASRGADPPTTVRPYTEPADATGDFAPNVNLELAAGGVGFAAGVGAFLNLPISTFPTGV
jgi:hypothetical protein